MKITKKMAGAAFAASLLALGLATPVATAGAAAPAAIHSLRSEAVGTVSSSALTTATSAGLVSAATQTTDTNTVNTFVASHGLVPTFTPGGTAAQYAAFQSAITAYWAAVPWTAVYGQWGCTVRDVTVTAKTSDAASGGPTVSMVSNCGSNATLSVSAGQVNTKAAIAGGNTPVARELAHSGASPAVAESNTNCGTVSSASLCAFAYSNGTRTASAEWLAGSSTTGHVRLGYAGTCSYGTLISNSPTVTLTQDELVSTSGTVDLDSTWSSRFYNPNFYGMHCYTY